VAFPSTARPLEYLFYQTLVGAWPYGWDGREGRGEFALRLEAYMTKASREAKQDTSWLAPDADFERRVSEFVRLLFENETFVDDARRFAELVAPFGAMNGLAACLLRHASPGIPDTYQGAELWHQRLVDPDNRTPVDYALRRKLLAELDARAGDRLALVAELLRTFEDGRIKLHVIHRALLARREHSELFLRGDYEPLDAGEHAVAFARGFESSNLLCVVPRLPYRLTGGRRAFPVGDDWRHAQLEVPHAGRYENVLTGETLSVSSGIALGELFREFPLALLVQARS
jgi:(1->4)-alpha-D-glucan 1-alpha-D-glucosylmutase